MSNSRTRNFKKVGGSNNSSRYPPIPPSSTYTNQYSDRVRYEDDDKDEEECDDEYDVQYPSIFHPSMKGSPYGYHGHPDRVNVVHRGPTPRTTFYPSTSVSRFQDQPLEVIVEGCYIFKDDEVLPWQHLYVLLKYGGRKYKMEGSIPTTKENFVIQRIEGLREMDIYVSKSDSKSFIGTGKIELHKVLSQGFDSSVWPLKSNATSGRYSGDVYLQMHYSNPILYNAPPDIMDDSSDDSSGNLYNASPDSSDDSSGNLYNASPEIMDDSPGKVEKSKRKKGSLHPSNGDVRSRSNREVMEKLNDMKISEVKNTASFQSSEGFLGELEKNTPKRFSHKDLENFTSGFSDKIGSGGFGNVYGGQLHGAQVAVKVLAENHLIEESFKAEVSAMFKTCHRNLVKCYGYCYDHKMKALVYEYMENGSLNAILYGNPRKLEWAMFYKIAIETAKGLSYLHDGCDHQIIHHDLKPSNVLLDINLSAKITDFGLARLIDKDVTHVTRLSSNFRGTVGYMAPEVYTPFSEITSKCDVFSFGMMLFEILAMRRTADIPKWSPKQVWLKFDSGEVDEIIDECGVKEKDRDNAMLLSVVALWCTQHTPQARPPMSTVVNMLEGQIQVKKPPNPYLPAPQEFYWEVSPSPSADKSVHENRYQKKGAGSIREEFASSSKLNKTTSSRTSKNKRR